MSGLGFADFVVYFIRAEKFDVIKIGYTTLGGVLKRQRPLEAHFGRTSILGVVGAGRSRKEGEWLENKIKRMFRDCNLHNEIFAPSERLLDYIKGTEHLSNEQYQAAERAARKAKQFTNEDRNAEEVAAGITEMAEVCRRLAEARREVSEMDIPANAAMVEKDLTPLVVALVKAGPKPRRPRTWAPIASLGDTGRRILKDRMK